MRLSRTGPALILVLVSREIHTSAVGDADECDASVRAGAGGKRRLKRVSVMLW